MKKNKDKDHVRYPVEFNSVENPAEVKKNRQGRSLVKKLFITLFILLFFIALISVITYGYIYYLLGQSGYETYTLPSDLGIGSTNSGFDSSLINYEGLISQEFYGIYDEMPFYFEKGRGITNIALFGIDSSSGVSGRSDAILILTLDSYRRQIRVSSIIRDSYVYIPGRGMDKINHAYFFGGPELAVKTLNKNFQLDIEHFVAVDFASMRDTIDRLGGIYIDLSEAEAANIRGIDGPGRQLLNGRQAVAFSRLRAIDSDIERSRRQRDVIEAVIESILSESVTEYPGLATDLISSVKTSMSRKDIIFAGIKILISDTENINQKTIPGNGYARGQMINGIYYYVFDRKTAVNETGRFIYLNEE